MVHVKKGRKFEFWKFARPKGQRQKIDFANCRSANARVIYTPSPICISSETVLICSLRVVRRNGATANPYSGGSVGGQSLEWQIWRRRGAFWRHVR